jgi:hypothetical protein
MRLCFGRLSGSRSGALQGRESRRQKRVKKAFSGMKDIVRPMKTGVYCYKNNSF